MKLDLQQKIESILACPNCHGTLVIRGEDISCHSCASVFKKTHGKYYFRNITLLDKPDAFDKMKDIIKRFDKFYQFLIQLVAPTMKMIRLKKYVNASNSVVLEIGSGNSNLDNAWIKLDYFDYPNVHIICDTAQLPIKDESVDTHYNVSVLEHVADPAKVVAEIYRTLKKGGNVVSSVPFLVPYHASPHDYHRFTSSGVLNLYKQFKVIELGVRSGPISALLWVFEETVATLLSFGSRRLRYTLLIFLYLLLFPFKLLDLLFIVYPFHAVEGIASNFYFIGEKE